MKNVKWLCFLICIFSILALHAQRWDSIHNGLSGYTPPDVIYADSNYLYMAGEFHIINGQYMQGIARWNGVKWDSMGAGIDRLIGYDSLANMNPEHTCAMATYQHKLYVSGDFWSLGYLITPGIGVWNGTVWDTIPVQPFKASYTSLNQSVLALAIIDNKLYMGGDFDTVAGKPCIGIACWNDTNWSSLNFSPELYFDQINAISEYKGSIYVGGSFDGTNTGADICRWDSLGWHRMGIGVRGSLADVWCVAVYDGALYVGGEFSTSDGNAGNNIEKWDGTQWSDVGGGTDYWVENMFVYNGKLYAMGVFTKAGGIAADGIAEWDGTKWCSFAGKINNDGIVSACLYKDSLYIAGSFNIIDSDTISYLAEWAGGDYTDSCEITTGINEISNPTNGVVVYPNPSNGIFTVQINSQQSTPANYIEVYNVLGEKVYSQLFTLNSQFSINLSNQPSGVYLYRIVSETGGLIGEGKIIVQR